MQADGAPALTVEETLITEALVNRPNRLPDYQGECRALAALMQEMASNPSGVLPMLARFALTLCRAESAGVSVPERDGPTARFRWRAVAGELSGDVDRTLPGDDCASGVTQGRNTMLLFDRPARCFASYRAIDPPIREALHVPWRVNGTVVGTVWAVTHGQERHFDAEDARLLQSLASSASAAHQLTSALSDAQDAGRNLAHQVAERTRTLQNINTKLHDEAGQRKQVEDALRESEARLQAAISIETVGVLFFDLDGTMADANGAFEQMSGYSREDLRAAAHWDRLVPLEFLGVTTRAVTDLATTGRTQPYERQLIRKDGTRWWGLFAPTRLSGTGMASKCAEFALDITERKRAETECVDSEERFRALVEGLAQAVWEADAQGQAESVSPGWSEYTGQPGEEWLGEGWANAVHPDDRAYALSQWKDAIAAQRVVNAEFRLHVATGGWRWTNVRAAPIWNPDGTVRKWVGMNIDVDDRRSAQEALRESEARFRALAEASPALIWQIDTQGNTVYLNQRYLTAIGLTPGQLLETGWHTIVHPRDLPGFLSRLQTAQHDHCAFQSRLRVKIKDAGWHWFETCCAPWFSASGEFRGHVCVSIDVTEAVNAEDALKEADRRKDEFLATLAHELRNPLAPIANALHLIRRSAFPADSAPILDMLDRQVHHMVRLIDDLMEVSRITRGKIGLVKAPVALAEIIENAIETSRPAIDQAHHELSITLPDTPLVLDADRVRLTQVFANMLNNAARYTDTGGQIRLDAMRESEWVVVTLSDTGIGMSAEQIGQVFEMFTQVSRPADRNQGGLGIGLTMVRHLVRMHGGTVEAASAGPGKGSTFTVRLPLSQQMPAEARETPATVARAAKPLAGKRILVVDDNRDAADSLAMVLSAEGAQVRVVYDGAAALGALEQSVPHAVVLDIGMPGMDGYEIARQIRQSPSYVGLQIIALTGWGQHADRLRSRMSGIDSHLTKPVAFHALFELLIAR
ncbi:PAS domain S-box protein [Paraburkholderia sp. CNPSo 3076]|uniref:PAS domain-containing hybrid sensor histidine kinase/response regulator n=1 Tax=Paraburkholderia sp. CNPSo 3076 TaxID=2940936 RepID=UPI002251F964|nr:PAS domain S-box protein [Paraburkholderia sp. CNPSo 3076]MCX5539515.1 PAS domain S-box protein [Paraburkholderia sp. CNPSo 3076]